VASSYLSNTIKLGLLVISRISHGSDQGETDSRVHLGVCTQLLTKETELHHARVDLFPISFIRVDKRGQLAYARVLNINF
jgi:hypothetical protein